MPTWNQPRSRLWVHHVENAPDLNVKINVVCTSVFDDKRQTALTHNADLGKNPAAEKVTAGIITGSLRCYPFREGIHTPLFLGHGVVAIHDQDMIYPGKLTFEPDIEFLQVHGTAVHDGRTCLVLRTPIKRSGSNEVCREIWVDPSRDSAVLRRRSLTNQIADIDMEIRYQKSGGNWLVKGWKQTVRLPLRDGTVATFAEETMAVSTTNVDPVVSDEDFQLKIEPGMRVETANVSEPTIASDPVSYKILAKKSYRVMPNGSWQEIIVVDGVEKPRFNLWAWWYLVAIPIAAAALYMAWRWWSVRRLRTPSVL
jgi:hypothetical protein